MPREQTDGRLDMDLIGAGWHGFQEHSAPRRPALKVFVALLTAAAVGSMLAYPLSRARLMAAQDAATLPPVNLSMVCGQSVGLC